MTIRFEDRKRGDATEDITYHEPEGIVGYIRDLNQNSETLHEPVYFKGEADGIQVEAWHFSLPDEFRENVLGFCNNIYQCRKAVLISLALRPHFTTVMNYLCQGNWHIKRKRSEFYRGRYPEWYDCSCVGEASGAKI